MSGRRSKYAGRRLTRRALLQRGGLAALSAAAAASIPRGSLLAQTPDAAGIPGKEGLVVLNDRPLNAEAPAHLLDDPITPAEHLFVRNNGIPPATGLVDPAFWTLEIGGESAIRPVTFDLAELKARFESHTCALQLECGGNGRSEFHPPASGNQWTTGAIGCAEWTGARLKDVLEHVGVADDAVYVAYYGADRHLSGDPDKAPISRGVPIDKAMENESLIAWAMNGKDIPLLNGHPLRLVIGGWPGSVSGKWLRRIVIRNRVHDGPKMTGKSYRVPCEPVAPGSDVPDEAMCIIESMPVKSLITHPRSGLRHPRDERLAIRGHAWAGDLAVDAVHVSIDFGATWRRARLDRPVNRLAWQRWRAEVGFPQPGYYEVWVRATDTNGRSQPMLLPGWNPKGYLNNACHRIAVQAV